MFSKAKRFEIGASKSDTKDATKPEPPTHKCKSRLPVTVPKPSKPTVAGLNPPRCASDQQSEAGSIRSITSAFATPKPSKICFTNRGHSSCKKEVTPVATPKSTKKPIIKTSSTKDLVAAQEVEIRNKDYTISEYRQQIEELKNEIAALQDKSKQNTTSQKQECLEEIDQLNREIEKVRISQDESKEKNVCGNAVNCSQFIDELQEQINVLQNSALKLQEEILEKQMELSDMENLITIRDSLCKDLQNKLTEKESALEEMRQRLEMVNGHHTLALEANESIRREYKVEIECLKTKLEEEKQIVLMKCKNDQESIKGKYMEQMESLRNTMENDRQDTIMDLERKIKQKDEEMKAKLEQVEERAHERVRLCEIQYEQRSRSMQEHWKQQQEQLKLLELEIGQLKYSLSVSNEQKASLQSELARWIKERDTSQQDRMCLIGKIDELEEQSKKKSIEYENERNKLTAEVERVLKEKQKFEMSLSVTRDIVQVLSMRLRESDNELDNLESKLQSVTNSKQFLEDELASYKNSLNNTLLECNEYKEALVNILKSKAALAKEHNRIMEHNVSLIESLHNVEKEAYRELGTIKEEMVEDVEMIKMESKSQIQKLREEVEKKRALALLATEQAGQAAAAAEQSRLLLQHAAQELDRLEADNNLLQQQIHDQQSMAVEVSLLRQENEELTMTVAKQSSIIDKMKKDFEQQQANPKSPSVQRKAYKVGKENSQMLISPLRERNH